MIQGQATPEATRRFVERHLPGGHGQLGATSLWASRAGFGSYRVTAGVEAHESALRQALLSGINLIDTSSNYTDGGSETLVGRVLADLVASKDLTRQEVIVVSKVGYLQGKNLAVSQQRIAEGRPFAEVVLYDQGLAHCIHPDFLEDQLSRSLDRLKLQSLDVFLLHNPEYYLGWAEKNDVPIARARQVYYDRIRRAFEHLETEVAAKRIGCYGISSNTFPAGADTADFTHLETIWQIAESISAAHHFRVIQLPLNILENGAVLEKNQSGSRSVLDIAAARDLAVLINRPLNAFDGRHLIRLSDIGETRAKMENEIIQAIRAVTRSETRLWRKLLPDMDLQLGVRLRIKEQIAIGDVFKHYWRNFGSYERFREMRDGNFRPRVEGVIDYLRPYADANPLVEDWIAAHRRCLEDAFAAVGSTYAEAAAVRLSRIGQAMSAADPQWAAKGSMSQRAIRVVASTKGVSTVLVGMRRPHYVDDTLGAINGPMVQKDRQSGWETLNNMLQT